MEHDPHEDREVLRALERRLAAWRPSAGALDRDRMLYDAGRAAAQGRGRIRTWRLAAAALAVVTLGLGVLLERERSQRRALEIALAARATPPRPSPPAPPVEVVDIPPIETPAPNSYFAWNARLAAKPVDDLWPDLKVDREPHPSGPEPRAEPPRRAPLRPRDIEKVLDL
jgi:hypothetical protein